MSGNLGRSTSPITHNGQEIVLTPRTSDPASTSEGDMWLRSDIAPDTDQIGTLRFDHGSGTWDVPVYQTGTSGTAVEEVLRVPVGGTVGYIPISATNNTIPAFSKLRLQHAGSKYGLHDATSAMVTLEDFEDGDATDWTNDSGAAISAVQTTANGGTAYEGSWMGESVLSSGTNSTNYKTLNSAISPTKAAVAIRLENADSVDSDRVIVRFSSGSNGVLRAEIDSRDSNVRLQSDLDSGIPAQQDTWFLIEWENIDWSNDQVGRILVDGTEALTNVAFENSASSVDRLYQLTIGTGSAESYTDSWRRG